MASQRVVDGFRRVAERLRDRGFDVVEVPGWEGRGLGMVTPAGKVNHHTAGPRSLGKTASLRVCTFGREGLRNALCNWYRSRGPNPKLYIVAAGLAWHAGTGSWRGLSGNSSVIGEEQENNGVGEPWRADELELSAALDEELAREFGYSTAAICEHKEWTPRKIDRTGISGDAWRARIAAGLDNPALAAGAEQEQGMYRCKQDDKGPDVVLLQKRLKRAGQDIAADGHYGPATVKAVAAVCRTKGTKVRPLEEDRIEDAIADRKAEAIVAKVLRQLERSTKTADGGPHSHKATVTLE